MAKTRPRPTRVSTKPRRKRRPPSFYERNRSRLWIGAIGAVAILVVFLFNRGGGEGEKGSALPFTGGDFHSMVIDPQDPSRIFVGGHQAVAVSGDGGKSWRQIDSLENADAMGWAFLPDHVLVGGHPGISASTDGGKTFRRDNGGLLATDIHALGAGDGVVYAASPVTGFMASTDGRRSWEIRSRTDGRSFMGRIVVDPKNIDHVIAPDLRAGAVESADGGKSWARLGGAASAMWVSWNPEDARLVAAGPQGASVSPDGGKTWSAIDLPDGASIVEMSPADPEVLFAGIHDGSRVTVRVSRDGGKSWAAP
jgi:photosystem II stability/assembly factor-like uncharacterized protein